MEYTAETCPRSFDIKIDRNAVRAYNRAASLVALVLFCGFWGAFIGTMAVTNAVDSGKLRSMAELWSFIGQQGLMAAGIGSFVGLAFYLGISHWWCALAARNLSLSVDGPFLCIKDGAFARRDRKIHFRCVHDYCVIDHWLARRFGVQILRMTTSGIGQNAWITIAGIKDCLKVRDLLAKIDARRENG